MTHFFHSCVNYVADYIDYKKSKWAYSYMCRDVRRAYKKISVYVGMTGFAPKTSAKYDVCIIVHKENKKDFFKYMDDLFPGVTSRCLYFRNNKRCRDKGCEYFNLQKSYVVKSKLLKKSFNKYEQSKAVFAKTKQSLKGNIFQRG